MSGGVVCYIERTPGGGSIQRLRLIAAGLARQWTAPEPRSVSSVDSAAGGPPASVNAARAGATWIAETLGSVGLQRLAAVCVDAEGSICAWLSASSPDQTVVRATILQSGTDGDGSGAGMGTARLIAGSDSGAGFLAETSVQALATIDPAEPSKRFSLRASAPAAPTHKHRYAVLAVQDAIVRVLLDELDTRGVEIDRVVSIWHAMACGWDHAAPASLSDRLVSSDSPGGAVILVEPTGRLIWAWTRAGELVAGGAMRLAAHSRPIEPASAPDAAGQALAAPDAARRASGGLEQTRSAFDPLGEPTDSGITLEFSTAEAGRLAVDWLSWSAQLGHCPRRVVCLSSPSVCDGSLGPEALFAHLTRCWPGATIDGAVHDDPIGATIGRLAGLGPEPARTRAEDQPAPDLQPYHARPREALTDLSSRAGLADRRLYQWTGVALIAAAGLVGVLGWQLNHSAALAEAELGMAKDAGRTAIAEAAQIAPNITQPGVKPVEALETAITRLRDQAKFIKPPRPMILETVRVVLAVEEVNSAAATPAAPQPDAPKANGSDATKRAPAAVQPDAAKPDSAKPDSPKPETPKSGPSAPTRAIITELEFSPFAGTVKLSVPDATTGPAIVEKIQKSPGVLVWQGFTPPNGSNASSDSAARNYTLTSSWPEESTNPPKSAKKPDGKGGESSAKKP
jgi:hypothetical protein